MRLNTSQWTLRYLENGIKILDFEGDIFGCVSMFCYEVTHLCKIKISSEAHSRFDIFEFVDACNRMPNVTR
jgi:hypothetical protein